MFGFEKLEVWQKAIGFADTVYAGIATGSLHEVISQAFVGRNQGFLQQADFDALHAAAEEQGRMLSGLRRSLVPEG